MIDKLKDQLRKLEIDIETIRIDKDKLERQKNDLEKDLKLEKELNQQKDSGTNTAKTASASVRPVSRARRVASTRHAHKTV